MDNVPTAKTGSKPGRAQLYLATHTKKDGSYVNEEAKEICVLGKEHPGRVRCLGLGATPSNTFKEINLRLGNIRIVSNNVGCSSSGCQEKYNQLMNTLKAYMIMKERSIPEQFAGIFASPPTTPSNAANRPVSPTDARRSSGARNPSDSH
ncbi:uncharacterized protein LOC107826133 isoform X1 [Nicotiana tabacum]|uniref:Uncharacterized protein LOC107826133 isoform X1 n=3 Tax=Nicotiana TaxID=4085 RepID=A0A1S4D5F4_TOBAC|nr:PREDICTED: uncharacterized protein LOC104238361 isoform X2 [Nicotiana sylvestris]XP_016508568.1 PREDICTED: uncharacterized protein LOC107826133 isoform X1 [Nicotiana tabacum]